MAEFVYILCAVTSLLCAILLWRGFKTNRNQLLFWSSICFIGFALNNILVFIDIVSLPQYDLSSLRILPALVGISALIYGLTREVRK